MCPTNGAFMQYPTGEMHLACCAAVVHGLEQLRQPPSRPSRSTWLLLNGMTATWPQALTASLGQAHHSAAVQLGDRLQQLAQRGLQHLEFRV